MRNLATQSKNLHEAVIGPNQTYGSVTDSIANICLGKDAPVFWYAGLLAGLMLAGGLAHGAVWLFLNGVGIWGLNIPVGWGFAIINFVWWIGIGHAGTLISAILLLFRQDWRTSINRFAEAMTLFAVASAGLFPLLHVGRPWLAFWLMPYPNTMNVWPQFRSPLVWDVFAVSTYATVSALFWYTGLIPDLATMRDRAQNKVAKTLYGIFSLGWRGAARHWERYEIAYLILGGLSTPLVVSVHTVVSFDFAVSVIPGWHATLFPPYFVAGAIYSGFAMVLTLAIPVRHFYKLHDLITMRHIEAMAKITLATGLVVFYGYLMEVFFAWYSGNPYEQFMMKNRMMGPYGHMYWALIFCNGLTPQLLWFRKIRRNIPVLFVITLIVNVGMWLERFVIVVTSLHRDFLPSSWDMYYPTFWDWAIYIGSIGQFLVLFFLFLRFVPMIAMFEVKHLVPQSEKTRA
ncbi:MAG: polysulfide reductase NrfD [Bryobacterales bacterium]|nr:polysulfide reductase NrfD [Bryobacterales bacterium]